MQWFKDLRIKMKLMTAFLLVLALTAILGIFATIELTRISAMTGDMANNALPGVRNISRINALVGSFRRAELLMAISDDDAGVRKYIDRNRETLEKLKTARSEYEKLIDNDTERKTYAEFSAAWESYLKEDPKIVELSIQHKVAEASRLIRGDSSKYFNQAIKALDANEDFQTKQALDKGQRCFAVNTSARVWIVIALVACITLGLILAVVIAGLITGPIQELEEKAARVATGDLTVEVSRCSRDEVGDLAGSFGRLTESLRTTIRKVNETSTLVASASTQLQATSEQIATGAEELANQSQGVATSSEEMSATSNDIARNCQAVALSSRQANDAAQSGADVVALTVEVMTRIAERVNGTARSVESLGARSDQIGAIVSTIEDIADQTNLLALNAAIEAARAGEQGRGFAVVADEVRALAERTTKATREIGAMIKAIQSETHDAVVAMEKGVRDVQQGTEEAAKSGSALKEILEQINSVTMQVNQIATAAEEQTATISEITSNIHQISDVVQQTAQGSQESAAAAAQLAGLSNDLRAMVGQFRFV